MVELHSNFTPEGQKYVIDGVYPTNHQEHETIEITEGLNDWSEVGFYVFHQRAGRPRRAVGRRPHPPARARARYLALAGGRQPVDRDRLPARGLLARHLDVGDSADRRQVPSGRWYFAVNPALERTWHGPDVNQGIGFSPGAKFSYDFTKEVNGGVEYYADYGRIGDSTRCTTSSSRSSPSPI